MKYKFLLLIMLFGLASAFSYAREFNSIPRAWKWLDNDDVIFTFDGTYADSSAFVVNARTGKRTEGVKAPSKYAAFPVNPEGAVNLTYSPDSTKLAFTRDNDLYVVDIASGAETRLTYDGSDVILNGYASWVYYEEIFGRPSRYKAFWWSPDSKKIGFYRFDNSQVPMFPIYSAFANPSAAASQSQSPRVTDLALGGSLSETRYPKAGQTNPQVRIGIIDMTGDLIWADFDPARDQYFGIPFWGPDSKEFFIARMPRLQNTIDLYAVNAADGSKRHVYNETYKTWLNWFDGTKKQAQETIKEEALRAGEFFVNERWLGGMLTNYQTIEKRIKRLRKLEEMEADGTLELLTKKEKFKLLNEKDKLERFLGGIKDMPELPGALFVIDPRKEKIAVTEAKKLGIPVVAIVDTNCDPDDVDYVIPGNDDAIRAVKLLASVISDAVLEAKQGESMAEAAEEAVVEEAVEVQE